VSDPSITFLDFLPNREKCEMNSNPRENANANIEAPKKMLRGGVRIVV